MSTQQAIIIGLGQFGMALAEALVRGGTEIVAVDRRSDRIQRAAQFATEAVELDAMDEVELARLRPGARDLCVCAIGDESREASIVVTALLRQMGARHIVARATDDLHERILRLVGAHEVLNPERIYGERLAARLSARGVVDLLPLSEDLVISEIEAPPSICGRSLAQLQLPRRFHLTVLAVRRSAGAGGAVEQATAETRVERGDTLIAVGPPSATQRFTTEA